MVIQDWAAVVVGSLQSLWYDSLQVLGSIVGALIVLFVGLIVAHYIARLVEQVIKGLKIDKVLAGLGIEEYFSRAGMRLDSGIFFHKLVYWFLVVVFLLASADILGFYALSAFLRETLLFIPNVLVSVLIMLAAVVIANFLRRLVQASVKSAGLHAVGFLSTLTWWAVVIFGFFAALTQLGIAVAIIQSLVTGFVAMLALAGGIAFGIGGKDYATHLLAKFRDRVER
jgi:hypothetical protein